MKSEIRFAVPEENEVVRNVLQRFIVKAPSKSELESAGVEQVCLALDEGDPWCSQVSNSLHWRSNVADLVEPGRHSCTATFLSQDGTVLQEVKRSFIYEKSTIEEPPLRLMINAPLHGSELLRVQKGMSVNVEVKVSATEALEEQADRFCMKIEHLESHKVLQQCLKKNSSVWRSDVIGLFDDCPATYTYTVSAMDGRGFELAEARSTFSVRENYDS
eukprot:g5180.t1